MWCRGLLQPVAKAGIIYRCGGFHEGKTNVQYNYVPLVAAALPDPALPTLHGCSLIDALLDLLALALGPSQLGTAGRNQGRITRSYAGLRVWRVAVRSATFNGYSKSRMKIENIKVHKSFTAKHKRLSVSN